VEALNLKTFYIIVAVSLYIVFANGILSEFAFGQEDTSCTVEIVGGSDKMYPGQSADLFALVTGSAPLSYSWQVEGDILKDYDDNVLGGLHGTLVNPPIQMTLEDFLKPSISFYWKPSEDKDRTVSVAVTTMNGTCQKERIIVVEQGNDTDTQPEDFYVAQNHRFPTSTNVLAQHLLWHFLYQFDNPSYNDNGDLFFDFHKIYLDHFDAWRKEFGYPNITTWDPGTPLPIGIDVNHTNRNPSYVPQPLATYFQIQPSGDGPTDRVSNGNPCEEFDKPEPPWPTKQDALNDFDPDLDLLGCALTDPYHNTVHVEVGGDMSGTGSSPLDPVFWRWHKFVDNIAVARGSLPPSTSSSDTVESLTEISANDTTSPRIYYQNPFRLYPFITPDTLGLENPKISVVFTEPVNGVDATSFVVNNSTATNVSGSGAGPYVFSGFNLPEVGIVNVTVLSGNIEDSSSNKFQTQSWKYEMIKANEDTDQDGLNNEEEIKLLINPTKKDTDGDTLQDKLEVSNTCLNPLNDDSMVMNMKGEITNSTGIDSDNDGLTNIEEVTTTNSDPCT
jgi:hypothetical protein